MHWQHNVNNKELFEKQFEKILMWGCTDEIKCKVFQPIHNLTLQISKAPQLLKGLFRLLSIALVDIFQELQWK